MQKKSRKKCRSTAAQSPSTRSIGKANEDEDFGVLTAAGHSQAAARLYSGVF
jgi:hypothetical protein